MVLSKRSPPLDLMVAVTGLPPTLKVNKYSPPGCFCGREASTKRNKPQFPWYFNDEADDVGAGEEFEFEGAADVSPEVDPSAVVLASRREGDAWTCLEHPDRDASARPAPGLIANPDPDAGRLRRVPGGGQE